MGELNLEKINKQLSRVSIREKKGNLYLRGHFPENGENVRREMALGAKASKEGLIIALAKAKEVDAQLMLGKWESVRKEKLTVAKAIAEYEKDYWTKFEPTKDRLYAWKKNQYAYFKELPEDEIFDKNFLLKAVTFFDPSSYKQFRFCQLIRPVAKFHNIDFDFLPYMKYQQPEVDLRELPTDEMIIEAFETEKYLPHKWTLGILATFGLRPHEFYRSEYELTSEIPVVYVGKNTKKKKSRTAFSIPIDGLNILEIPNQWEIIEKTNDLTRCNLRLGQNITEFFNKYSFTPYQLRHYYAVRGAMKGISPLFVSKWMGHSLTVHYKYYGRFLGDRESALVWKENFS